MTLTVGLGIVAIRGNAIAKRYKKRGFKLSSCKCNQRLFEIDLMRRFVAERLPGAVVEPLHDVRDL